MTLSKEEKRARKRVRMLETAKQFETKTYSSKYVAPKFQRMIRAEAGAQAPGKVLAIVDDELAEVERKLGQCVCVTCGAVKSWSSGLGGMHTGHFLASRKNSILYREDNVAPQCSGCNRYRAGEPQKFAMWMEIVRGRDVVEEIRLAKSQTVSFSLEELVDMRIRFEDRLRWAEQLMKGCF